MEATKINALIALLDDPDENIFLDVKGQLEQMGTTAIPFLESAWEKSGLGVVFQGRIEELIHQIQFEALYDKLSLWKEGGCMDLIEGWILISHYLYPDLDEDAIREELEKIKQDIWIELNDGLTALEKVKVMNHILFDVHGFSGNTKNYHSPSNSFINTVLEGKKGNPISLSIIYMHLAQSLDLPIYGVNLPRHFILCYLDYSGMMKSFDHLDRDDMMFYINPFGKGSIFSNKEITQFVKELELEDLPMFYLPCNSQSIATRILNNLHHSYQQLGEQEKEEEMKRLLDLLAA
ncbi:transglutaminase-like domain-containing protein [Salibacteraceae bacterium]|jgi:regulator of sirC expression with transglutaminase-like and TPR domain|nr:transglutaminase-like domain-containing protein [Salibacteraceae bacterium]